MKVFTTSAPAMNQDSSLKREWHVISDAAPPAKLAKPAGVTIFYGNPFGGSNLSWHYNAEMTIEAKEPIAAFEVKLVLLDVFGNVITTLQAIRIADFPEQKWLTASWRPRFEGDAERVFESIAFVSKVRTAKGNVYEIAPQKLLDQVQAITKRATMADLDAYREPGAVR